MWTALAAVRDRHAEVRWIAPGRMHLTLVFLGSTEQGQVAEITAALAGVAGSARPFDVGLGAAGGRVGGRRGGVAWLQVAEGATEVARLAQELDEQLPGLRAGAINRPHLTVARRADEATLRDLRASDARMALRWTVERFVLFRSHTEPGGARYEEIGASRLGEPATSHP